MEDNLIDDINVSKRKTISLCIGVEGLDWIVVYLASVFIYLSKDKQMPEHQSHTLLE
jgi:hypothetical protein